MRCLFLNTKRYSLNDSVIHGVKLNGWEIKVVDYLDFFNSSVNSFVSKYESLPNKIKKLWKESYVKKTNKCYLNVFIEYQPDLVIIYNNQNLLPDTMIQFKRKAKIAYILGDNPLYSPTSNYNLHLLFYADYIICPDTFWLDQLKVLGVKNIYFDCFSFNPEVYFPFYPKQEQFDEFQSDIVYVGSAHKTNWGYKRFLFLNQFRNFNLKAFISGDGYFNQWKTFFPELRDKIIPHHSYDNKFNNVVYNCSKIAPVELVPSLFNGIHIRVFDVLGSGIFPLCEYSKDIDEMFQNIKVPFVKNYYDTEGITNELIKDECARKDLVLQMRDRIESKYCPESVIGRMLNKLNFN
jgi:spore maturation protein CgeB